MGPLVLTLVATLLEYADLELPRASVMGLSSLPPLPSPPSSIGQVAKEAITEPPSVPPPVSEAAAEVVTKAETKIDK
jgi:hypothetical protein